MVIFHSYVSLPEGNIAQLLHLAAQVARRGAPPETLWRTPLRIRPHQHHLPTAIRGKGRFFPTGSTWFNVVQ